jgi:hypothetical protein
MELPEQSVELVKVFIETSKIFLFFFSTRQPKNLKPAAQIQLKKYSSRDSVPLKCLRIQDEKEYILMNLLLLFSPDQLELIERNRVEQIQLHFAMLLHNYLYFK